MIFLTFWVYHFWSFFKGLAAWNPSKMMFAKSIEDHSGMVWYLQDIKKHQRDDKISTWRPPENFPKMTDKLAHMKSFWTLFSQISHAGACVAWRRASRGTFTWLLEQILAQSNYRTCWIFGSTSVSFLVPFSILFGEYLTIYPTDLDDFQNVPRHLITLEAYRLRLATALIYIWVFVKVGRHKWSKKWKFWWKIDVSQIDRESICDGP